MRRVVPEITEENVSAVWRNSVGKRVGEASTAIVKNGLSTAGNTGHLRFWRFADTQLCTDRGRFNMLYGLECRACVRRFSELPKIFFIWVKKISRLLHSLNNHNIPKNHKLIDLYRYLYNYYIKNVLY